MLVAPLPSFSSLLIRECSRAVRDCIAYVRIFWVSSPPAWQSAARRMPPLEWPGHMSLIIACRH